MLENKINEMGYCKEGQKQLGVDPCSHKMKKKDLCNLLKQLKMSHRLESHKKMN